MPPISNRKVTTSDNSTVETSELNTDNERPGIPTTLLGRSVARDNTVIPIQDRSRKTYSRVITEEQRERMRNPMIIAKMAMGKARAKLIRERVLAGETLDDITSNPPVLDVNDFVRPKKEGKPAVLAKPAVKKTPFEPTENPNVTRYVNRAERGEPRRPIAEVQEQRRARKPKVVYISASSSSDSSDSESSQEVIFKKKPKSKKIVEEAIPPPVKLTSNQMKKMAFMKQILGN